MRMPSTFVIALLCISFLVTRGKSQSTPDCITCGENSMCGSVELCEISQNFLCENHFFCTELSKKEGAEMKVEDSRIGVKISSLNVSNFVKTLTFDEDTVENLYGSAVEKIVVESCEFKNKVLVFSETLTDAAQFDSKFRTGFPIQKDPGVTTRLMMSYITADVFPIEFVDFVTLSAAVRLETLLYQSTKSVELRLPHERYLGRLKELYNRANNGGISVGDNGSNATCLPIDQTDTTEGIEFCYPEFKGGEQECVQCDTKGGSVTLCNSEKNVDCPTDVVFHEDNGRLIVAPNKYFQIKTNSAYRLTKLELNEDCKSLEYEAKEQALQDSNLARLFFVSVSNIPNGMILPSTLKALSLISCTDKGTLPAFKAPDTLTLERIHLIDNSFSKYPAEVLDLVDESKMDSFVVHEYMEEGTAETRKREFSLTQSRKDKLQAMYETFKFSTNIDLLDGSCSSGEIQEIERQNSYWNGTAVGDKETFNICAITVDDDSKKPDFSVDDKNGGNEEDSNSTGIIIGVSCAAVVLVVVFFIVFRYTKRKSKEEKRNRLRLLAEEHGIRSHPSYDYEDLIAYDRLQVLGPIGSGAYGEVLLAVFAEAKVVVKKQLDRSDRSFEQFKKEMALLKTLKHPNIVQYIGITQMSDHQVSSVGLVCEYMPRGELRQFLVKYKRWNTGNYDEANKTSEATTTTNTASTGYSKDSSFFELDTQVQSETTVPIIPPQDVLDNSLLSAFTSFTWQKLKLSFTADILSGLVYLHEHEPAMIHRDLKSPNVLLTEGFQAKISDFGSCKAMEENTMTSTGSAYWMAPEVIVGERFNEKADMYSFGVVLSEIITHELPYEHLTGPDGAPRPAFSIAIMVAQQGLRPDINRSLNSSSRASVANSPPPQFIVDLFERCISRDPAQRPSAREAMEVIRKYFD